MAFTIPKGKQVWIYRNGKGIDNRYAKNELVTGIPLILEEELTINLESNFEPLAQGIDNKVVNAVSGSLRAVTGFGVSGQLQQFGYQVWQNTAPIQMNLNFSFHVGIAGIYNAYTEVYNPIIELCKLPLPRLGSGIGEVKTLIPPGPTVLNAFLGSPTLAGINLGQMLSIQVGSMFFFNSIIVTRSEPTFADEYDANGYPIYGKIQLDVRTVMSATVELLTGQKSINDNGVSGLRKEGEIYVVDNVNQTAGTINEDGSTNLKKQ